MANGTADFVEKSDLKLSAQLSTFAKGLLTLGANLGILPAQIAQAVANAAAFAWAYRSKRNS